jgi:hypothetical protein
MPEIELSSSVYQRLLRRSSSFNDTAEDVISRLLDRAEGSPDSDNNSSDTPLRNEAPAPPGSILPVGEYWLPILSIIAEADGSAHANDVIDALEERMGSALEDRDRETLRNGEVRWRNRARFARLRMKERGLLSKASQRGIWEITKAGYAYLGLNR